MYNSGLSAAGRTPGQLSQHDQGGPPAGRICVRECVCMRLVGMRQCVDVCWVCLNACWAGGASTPGAHATAVHADGDCVPAQLLLSSIQASNLRLTEASSSRHVRKLCKPS